MKEEISISEFELENCEGNISSLIENWNSMPKLVSGMDESKGYVVEKIVEGVELSNQIKDRMNMLLENTRNFLSKTGDSVAKSDENAKKLIDSITSK